MPQDAFTIKYVTKELKDLLLGGKISKIMQPSRDLLTFIIYTQKGNVKLEACLSAQFTRLSLSKRPSPPPATPLNFCMVLRKHLQNAEIIDVAQPDFERIIYFDLKCTSDFSSSVMRLYFEIMGKYSNAILTKDGLIVGALKTTALGENTKRILFCGVPYTPPEPQDKINPEILSELHGVVDEFCDPKTLCDKIKGLSYSTAQEICALPNLTDKAVYDYIENADTEPCVTYQNGEHTDFKVRSCSKDKKLYPTLLDAQAAYYDYVTEKREFETKKGKLTAVTSSAIKKIEKRLILISEKIEECKGAEDIKLKGELITSNLYALQRGMSSFEAINYYDENCGKIKIILDKTLTPAQNAQAYYKKYAKLKRTYLSVNSQRAEAEEKLNYYLSILSHVNSADNVSDLEEIKEELALSGLINTESAKKKKEREVSFRTFTIDGFKVFAGKSNMQNEKLLKVLSGGDIWLHTQKYHSSHVGIVTEGKEVPQNVLLAAAEICAYYSDGKDGTKIPVDYTFKKYVKKPPKANLGFCIYTNYSTILVDPDKHGELKDETK